MSEDVSSIVMRKSHWEGGRAETILNVSEGPCVDLVLKTILAVT